MLNKDSTYIDVHVLDFGPFLNSEANFIYLFIYLFIYFLQQRSVETVQLYDTMTKTYFSLKIHQLYQGMPLLPREI